MTLTSRNLLVLACAASVIIASVGRVLGAGWVLLIGVGVYPPFILVHCIVHYYCLWGPRVSRRGARLLLAADATLVAAFLLQWDEYGGGFLVITRVFTAVTGTPLDGGAFIHTLGMILGLAYNAILLAPIVALWLAVLREEMRVAQRIVRRECQSCGYPFGDSETCPECGSSGQQGRSV